MALSLLIPSQFRMLASFYSQHSLRSAVGLKTFKLQDNLLCSFSLFAENWLSLSTITTPLPVMSLSLCIENPCPCTVTLWGGYLPHFLKIVQRVLGTFAMFVRVLSARKVTYSFIDRELEVSKTQSIGFKAKPLDSQCFHLFLSYSPGTKRERERSVSWALWADLSLNPLSPNCALHISVSSSSVFSH